MLLFFPEEITIETSRVIVGHYPTLQQNTNLRATTLYVDSCDTEKVRYYPNLQHQHNQESAVGHTPTTLRAITLCVWILALSEAESE